MWLISGGRVTYSIYYMLVVRKAREGEGLTVDEVYWSVYACTLCVCVHACMCLHVCVHTYACILHCPIQEIIPWEMWFTFPKVSQFLQLIWISPRLLISYFSGHMTVGRTTVMMASIYVTYTVLPACWVLRWKCLFYSSNIFQLLPVDDKMMGPGFQTSQFCYSCQKSLTKFLWRQNAAAYMAGS